MLISVRWLSRHVDLSGLTAAQIADALTLSTAEVEQVSSFLPHAAEVLVGRVVSRQPHPGADRLSICQVDVGQGEPLQIVCGASNVASGQNVPVALPGTSLPGIGKLKKGKIRGEQSLGMICSESEIGLAESSEGIWVLPAHCSAGQTLDAALNLSDSVIDIDNKSLTHRPDLWGHRGIAEELSAIFERPLLPLDCALPAVGSEPQVEVSLTVEQCSQYVAMPIDGANNGPSPLWLRALLAAVGQKTRGQVVDLSNFVMLDLGQPNHAFDREKLSASGLGVRRAAQGEPFDALDGQSLKLDSADLVIESAGRPVALAGVIGGSNSQVTDSTQSVLLEVATFHATTVRRTSVRHGLRTDSSARFEKSLDPGLPIRAVGHFARQLTLLQPGVSFPSAPTVAGPAPPAAPTIELRPDRVRAALGAPLADEEIVRLLRRLHFTVDPQAEQLLVTVPTGRATKDIEIEQDLVEEIGRLYGYGNIPERCLQAAVVPPPREDRRLLVRRVQDRLSGAARFTETIRYSFQPDEMLRLLRLDSLPHATVSNAVVATESRIRRTLVPSLLSNIESNRRYRDLVELYEVGKCYFPERSSGDPSLPGEPLEQHTVGLLRAAPPAKKGAHFAAGALPQLQAVVTDLLGSLELSAVRWRPAQQVPPWSAPQQCVEALLGDGEEVVAWVATLAPDIASDLGLTGRLASDVALAEVSLNALLAAPRTRRKFEPMFKYPGIKVDVAVAVGQAVPAGEVTAAVAAAAGKHCRAVELFDVYCGEAVGSGNKSLAYHVLLQAADRTLSDKEEQKFLARLGKGLGAIGAQLRDG